MTKNNENKINAEGVSFGDSTEENKQLAKTSEGKNNNEIITNVFEKKPKKLAETSEYIKETKETKQKIEDKLKPNIDPKITENLQKMLDELNKMGVEPYDYDKGTNKRKTSSVSEVVNPVGELDALSRPEKIQVKSEQGQIATFKEEKTSFPVSDVVEIPGLEKYVGSKEKQPNASLKELASRIEEILRPLSKLEYDEVMTEVLSSLLMKVKNNQENIDKPVTDNVLQFFEKEIEYLKSEIGKLKK